MRCLSPRSRGGIVATIAVLGALTLACVSEPLHEDDTDLLCGFDGDASPGYQEVWLDAYARDEAGDPVANAATGTTVRVYSEVIANLRLESYGVAALCNIEVTWEVMAGGGTLSSPTSNTGSTLVAVGLGYGSYVGQVDWILGPPGVQTLHGYVSDDHSIDTTISLTATAPPATNTVLVYNNTGDSAYVVGPGESAVAATRLQTHGSRQVAIPSAVASQSTFRAYLTPGTVAATITCTVTATAWTGGGQPLVTFYFDGSGHLSCAEGLVAP